MWGARDIAFPSAQRRQRAHSMGGIVRDILSRNLEGKDFQAPNFGILAAGEHTPWFVVNLLVDTYYDEKHTIEIMADSQKQITESNELDNRWEYSYVLQQGSCP